MATLFDTTKTFRRVGLLVLAAAILILLVDNVSKYLNSSLNPFSPSITFYAEADNLLGTIPKPIISSIAITDTSNPEFLVDGVFPNHPDTVLVYSIEKPREKLNTVDDAISKASTLGFLDTYSESGNDKLTWQNNLQTRTLRFDKVDQEWWMRTQYFQDIEAGKPKTIVDDLGVYENSASKFLSQMGIGNLSLKSPAISAKYAKLGVDGLFTSPASANLADYVSIDIYRTLTLTRPLSSQQLPESIDKDLIPEPVTAKVYSVDPRKGAIHLITTGQMKDFETDIYELDFTDYNYLTSNAGVRSIISPEEAWQRVRIGDGSLMLLTPSNSDYFSVNQIHEVNRFSLNAPETEIGYWEPVSWDGLVYPIYIFRGKALLGDGRQADFVFYVDALVRIDTN